jgi:DNA mismatch repair protein MutS
MAQWFAAKEAFPEALVFFRMGDFYEMFFADAEAAATVLDIALTHRGEHAGKPIPMCGVPVHAAEAYLARLIRRGFRVAVAEQLDDPKTHTAKAPLRREVVRLVTPGTLTEETLLEAGQPNLLLALAESGGALGAAWLDVSTGRFETQAVERATLSSLLGRLEPAEILAPASLLAEPWAARRSPSPATPTPEDARRTLGQAFDAVSLDAFGNFTDAEAVAAALALDYVRRTAAGRLPRLAPPLPLGAGGRLELDAATRASLEISRARDGSTAHTLLAAVQRTLTAAGARLLADDLTAPLADADAIASRQDAWSWLLANDEATMRLRAVLRHCPDMARALGRLSLGRGGPRDLGTLRDGLRAAAGAQDALAGPLPAELARCRALLDPAPALAARLQAALPEQVPARLEDGAIATGFDAPLDALRALATDGRRAIAATQTEYARRFGVANLKIRHHAQLGYVIEVPAAAVEALRAEPTLTLRQGMANGARFSSTELALLDRRIAEAAERASVRERELFAELVAAALAVGDALAATAAALARLDVAQSAAALAASGRWCRPEVAAGLEFHIEAGRHPVVEAALPPGAAFVPNDADLPPDRRLMLLTGPNMAGKSTYLRQNALLVVLAQAGLPVPAARMRLGLVDRLFSRVGAADDLARGRSTFMVEMMETAAILHQAGPQSLVVLDEIGRGTATLDGLAIAWAVLEALHTVVRCRVMFATHFHELAGLTSELPRLAPHTMRVKEWKGGVVFLHEVVPGAASRSWGVHVAALAGIPAAVVRRAAALLTMLEERAGNLTAAAALPLFAAVTPPATPTQPAAEPLLTALAALDPDQLTPREALETLYRLRTMLPSPLHPVAAGDGALT